MLGLSSDAIIVISIASSIPMIIVVAVVVKLYEVRQAKKWPQAQGVIVASRVQSARNRPGDAAYDFSDTEVTNEPFVEYEYEVGSKKLRSRRITIGEKTSGFELEAILAKYPIGSKVTVYYDPKKPTNAVLERDLPWGVLSAGVGCLMLMFVGGPLLAIFFYFNALGWLAARIPYPAQAPFVAAAGGFGILSGLFALAFHRMVRQAARWPTVPGRIVATRTEEFIKRNDVSDHHRRRRRMFKPAVVYRYQVNDRDYVGDRLTIGVVVSASIPWLSRRTANRYAVDQPVDVHYNPDNPGESVLHPRSSIHYLLWIVTGLVFWLAWFAATHQSAAD